MGNKVSEPEIQNTTPLEKVSEAKQSRVYHVISEKEQKKAKRLISYMDEAYTRVGNCIKDCLEVIQSCGGSLDYELEKLDLTIDNTVIQFQIVQRKFPNRLQESFNETITNMIKKLGNVYEGIPDEARQILNAPVTRFGTVLNLYLPKA